jgi:hypothetical protein
MVAAGWTEAQKRAYALADNRLPALLAVAIKIAPDWSAEDERRDPTFAPHYRSPTSAIGPAGQDLGAPLAPELTTVPLQSRAKCQS